MGCFKILYLTSATALARLPDDALLMVNLVVLLLNRMHLLDAHRLRRRHVSAGRHDGRTAFKATQRHGAVPVGRVLKVVVRVRARRVQLVELLELVVVGAVVDEHDGAVAIHCPRPRRRRSVDGVVERGVPVAIDAAWASEVEFVVGIERVGRPSAEFSRVVGLAVGVVAVVAHGLTMLFDLFPSEAPVVAALGALRLVVVVLQHIILRTQILLSVIIRMLALETLTATIRMLVLVTLTVIIHAAVVLAVLI